MKLILLLALATACSSTTELERLVKADTLCPVRVFVFDKKNVVDNPVSHKVFLESVYNWSKHVPIHFVITSEERIGGIEVRYADIQTPPYNVKRAIGLYYPQSIFCGERIVIDDDIELKIIGNISAINVCMHEIGHMLELDHIVGPEDPYHRGIATHSLQEAKSCIMYPVSGGVTSPHPIELSLLRERLDIPRKAWQYKGYVTIFQFPEKVDAPGRNPESSPDSK